MKPFDIAKFRKDTHKSMGIVDGYHDPKVWLDTGNYALNMMISGDFFKGVPLGKVTVFAGESGAGKSYIACGNLVRSAQAQGILPVILDSEYALDEQWLKNLGVDTSPQKLMRWPVALVDDCASLIGNFMTQYEQQMAGVPEEERQGVLFVIDSLGMLSTPTEKEQFSKGDMKGDLGRKAKQLKALVIQCLQRMGPHKIGLVATNHTYKSQDMFNPDDVISGGGGFIYASSIIVAMNKLKLKEDESGTKTSQVHGIRAKIKCVKTRYSKPFEEVEVRIPYTTGMDPYSGLFDFFEARGLISKNGSRYIYKDRSGKEHNLYRKEFGPDMFAKMMAEYNHDDGEIGFGDELEELANLAEESGE